MYMFPSRQSDLLILSRLSLNHHALKWTREERGRNLSERPLRESLREAKNKELKKQHREAERGKVENGQREKKSVWWPALILPFFPIRAVISPRRPPAEAPHGSLLLSFHWLSITPALLFLLCVSALCSLSSNLFVFLPSFFVCVCAKPFPVQSTLLFCFPPSVYLSFFNLSPLCWLKSPWGSVATAGVKAFLVNF